LYGAELELVSVNQYVLLAPRLFFLNNEWNTRLTGMLKVGSEADPSAPEVYYDGYRSFELILIVCHFVQRNSALLVSTGLATFRVVCSRLVYLGYVEVSRTRGGIIPTTIRRLCLVGRELNLMCGE
jgi:hypothetical protein